MIVHNGADLFWILTGLGLMFFLVCAGFGILKLAKQTVDENKVHEKLDMNERLTHDINHRLTEINRRFAPQTMVRTMNKQGK